MKSWYEMAEMANVYLQWCNASEDDHALSLMHERWMIIVCGLDEK